MTHLVSGSWLPSSVRQGVHLMEWAMNKIRKWLVIPTMFVPQLHQLIEQAGHHYKFEAL